jgi:hypothetical protein
VQTTAKALVALVLAFVAGFLVGRHGRPGLREVAARADSLDVEVATGDSLLAARTRADSVRLAEAARRTAAHLTRAVALGDTATRLASEPIPPAPESCTAQLEGLRGVVLRLVPGYDSAFASAAGEISLLRVTLAARDSVIDVVRAQRDSARILVRQALAIARPWPTWRKALAGASCVAAGYLVAQQAATPAVVAGVGCAAMITL